MLGILNGEKVTTISLHLCFPTQLLDLYDLKQQYINHCNKIAEYLLNAVSQIPNRKVQKKVWYVTPTHLMNIGAILSWDVDPPEKAKAVSITMTNSPVTFVLPPNCMFPTASCTENIF